VLDNVLNMLGTIPLVRFNVAAKVPEILNDCIHQCAS
jgi:hypothetical protein